MTASMKIKSLDQLEDFGRIRLSKHFYMRDFLYSEVSNYCGIPNFPDHPEVAIQAGRQLCEQLLEPLHCSFGGIVIRSAYRSPEVNDHCRKHTGRCANNEKNFAAHIWDYPDSEGCMGATACIVVPWLVDRYGGEENGWKKLAWWIHDKLPYSTMVFYRTNWAFNIQWHERPKKTIKSRVFPDRGAVLTKAGMDNHQGSHAECYEGFPELISNKIFGAKF